MTEVETARALYDRIRQDSHYLMTPYRAVQFVAGMMGRDPFVVLHTIGMIRVAKDDLSTHQGCDE